MELCGKWKCSSTDDCFKDPTPRNDMHESDTKRDAFERPTGAAEETRGQIASHAAALLARQFRTHAFSSLLTGPSVRFIRWDRSCAIVSEAILYVSAPKILVEFFWRYSRLTREQRGHDASASEANMEEAKAAADALEIQEQNKFFQVDGALQRNWGETLSLFVRHLGAARVLIVHTTQNNIQSFS